MSFAYQECSRLAYRSAYPFLLICLQIFFRCLFLCSVFKVLFELAFFL